MQPVQWLLSRPTPGQFPVIWKDYLLNRALQNHHFMRDPSNLVQGKLFSSLGFQLVSLPAAHFCTSSVHGPLCICPPDRGPGPCLAVLGYDQFPPWLPPALVPPWPLAVPTQGPQPKGLGALPSCPHRSGVGTLSGCPRPLKLCPRPL